MIELEISTAGIQNLQKIIKDQRKGSAKALTRAIRTEGFSLRMTLMQAIRMATPAPGVRLKDLSIIARTIKRKSGMRQPSPLRRLASAVTYEVDNYKNEMRVGFTRRSAKWATRTAERQQEGFSRPVTFKLRQHMRRVGAQRIFGRLMRGEKFEALHWNKRVLFLNRKTTRLKTPPRPIVEPFWVHQAPKSIERIRKNFRTIMKGGVAPGGVLISVEQMAGWKD
jgi:hypothetical protein